MMAFSPLQHSIPAGGLLPLARRGHILANLQPLSMRRHGTELLCCFNRMQPRKTASAGWRGECRAASDASSSASSPSTSSSPGASAWQFGFQVNERFLAWDDAAARQLIKLVLSEKMDMQMDEIESRLSELAVLVPELVGKLEKMRADILVTLLSDLPGLTHKLLVLRELLPGVNISQLVARWPYVVLDFESAALVARVAEMRSQLPGVAVERLVNEEPMLLKADLNLVLQNIRRVLPESDPVLVLVNQPQMVLDMTSAGMTSALDVEGIPQRE